VYKQDGPPLPPKSGGRESPFTERGRRTFISGAQRPGQVSAVELLQDVQI